MSDLTDDVVSHARAKKGGDSKKKKPTNHFAHGQGPPQKEPNKELMEYLAKSQAKAQVSDNGGGKPDVPGGKEYAGM